MRKTINNPPEVNSGDSLTLQTGLRLSSEDKMRQLIRQELFRQAMGRPQAESFEDADDFDFEDEEEWHSPYEIDFDPVEHSGFVSAETNTPPDGAAPNPPPATVVTPATDGGGGAA